MSKKISRKIVLLVLLAIGAMIFLYPFYINSLNYFIDQQRMKQHEVLSAKEQKAKKTELETRNNQIKVDGLIIEHDPFDANQGVKESVELKDHLIGSITIPSIDAKVPIYDTVTNQVLENGAGVLPGTSLPVGGEGTHSVLSAHRGLAERILFRNLDKVTRGDYFLLDVLGDTLAYEVIGIETVSPEDTEVIALDKNKDLVSLLTCTPYMVNSHRLIVTGKRVPLTKEMTQVAKTSEKTLKLKEWGVFLGTGMLLLLVGYLFFRWVRQWLLAKRQYDLVFYVKDSRKKPLEHQVFVLYSKYGKKPLKRQGKILVGESRSNGKVVFKGLPGGEYRLGLHKKKNILAKVGVTQLKAKKLTVLKELLPKVRFKEGQGKVTLTLPRRYQQK